MFGGSMLQTTKMFGFWFFNAHCATITASKSSSVIWSTRFGGILFKAGGVPTNSPTRFMKCWNSIDKQTMKNVNFQCSLSKMSQKTSVQRLNVQFQFSKKRIRSTLNKPSQEEKTSSCPPDDNHIYCWDGRLCGGLSHYSRTMKSLDTQFC